jgi:SAM-dependent methyltransferase
MAGFDNPLETWNARFAREGFFFGEEPNAFLRTQSHWLRPGGSVLCVADGEGRNSVWLAEQGFQVTAFDFAPNAVAKAKRLAQRRNVSVKHELGDIYTWPWTAARYDAVVAVFIQFLPPDLRDSVFAGMKSAVEPGGLFLLEGYRPEQVDYGTGGPPRRSHVHTRWLESMFSGWRCWCSTITTVIEEGQAHKACRRLSTWSHGSRRKDAALTLRNRH